MTTNPTPLEPAVLFNPPTLQELAEKGKLVVDRANHREYIYGRWRYHVGWTSQRPADPADDWEPHWVVYKQTHDYPLQRLVQLCQVLLETEAYRYGRSFEFEGLNVRHHHAQKMKSLVRDIVENELLDTPK